MSKSWPRSTATASSFAAVRCEMRRMTAIAQAWSILATRSLWGKGIEMAAILAWLQKLPSWLKYAGSTIAGALLVITAQYYYFGMALPDLKQAVSKLTEEVKENRKEYREAEQRQITQLSTHVTQEQSSRDRTDSSIRVVKAYLISLVQKVENRELKPSELKELVSSVGYVSKSEAVNFSGHTVVSGPKLPAFPSSITTMIQKGVFTGEESQVFWYADPKDNKPTLTKFIAAALLQKDGKWEATDKGIKFFYGGGSSIFTAKQNVSKLEIIRTVDLFNSMSQAVSLTISGENKAPKAQH